jgi:hypothetical protein
MNVLGEIKRFKVETPYDLFFRSLLFFFETIR